MRTEEFNYHLPDSAIAQEAVEPRHDARLLDTRDMSDHRFLDLPELLSPGDLVVLNETKVRRARLRGVRVDTGGRVEMLLLERADRGHWRALARPARRLRPGVSLVFGDGLEATVVSWPDQGVVVIALDAEDDEAQIAAIGEIPLPPYFKGELESSDRYQTVFARTTGSAAAPTAGLHFTDQVFARLDERGIQTVTIDLHVSLATFRPIDTENVEDHRMHTEWCAISEETALRIEQTRRRGNRVVAVGTTVVRTLESFADETGVVAHGEQETDLYLTAGHRFKVVDALVTNFHMPSSSLLVLVEAFMGPHWRDVYSEALRRGYRFLSFGDAMLADRHDRTD